MEVPSLANGEEDDFDVKIKFKVRLVVVKDGGGDDKVCRF